MCQEFAQGSAREFLLCADHKQWHHQNNPNGSCLIANLD
jgi:hypothetical protein